MNVLAGEAVGCVWRGVNRPAVAVFVAWDEDTKRYKVLWYDGEIEWMDVWWVHSNRDRIQKPD